MSNYRQQSQWSAEQVLAYIVNLQAADEENQFHAFATAYNYFMNLTKKKISWSVHLQKLAYEFIQLAFDNNKHSSIKDVLKSYRSLTQGQYSQSLKDVLEHYRDRKLQAILEEDILYQNLATIRDLPNIESQQASSTIIFSSFKPDEKKKLQELRNKLKIVWEGYKYIIETVKINQKLQEVFKETLYKIFAFVDKYNRKHEFKSFCKTLKETLRTVLNKRERTEQQRSIYIDIEKTDVNDRNIQIRLEQFKTTIKLGLWQEAFQVLEDINSLMRVRKGALKSNIRYKYFQNLALLFKKSQYWHYHAFAFYNKFLAAQKNPKLTIKEKKDLSDELLLSVLSIPPVTLESAQSKESQQKISSMMISSTKLPSKEELSELIISSGILEFSSPQIRNLWSFMSMQFDLESLSKGLELLNSIGNGKYTDFKGLIEDILVYRQLQSVSQIYQRIKIDSLLALIPLEKQKIERILLSSYHQKILDFVLDEDQKIIIFEDKSSQRESTPTEAFFDIYIDLAIEKEKQRDDDQKHIMKKLQDFVTTSEDYYWKIRQYKIEEYRKKLKKPKQQLLNEAHRRKIQEQEERERLEIEKLAKESEAIKLAEEKKKQFGVKKIIINDIKDIKQARVVRILGKKVEQLTDQEIQNISIETLNNALDDIKTKIQNNRDARYKKALNHIDYAERERRERLQVIIKENIPSKQEENKKFEQIKKDSKTFHDQQHTLKTRVQKMMTYLKPKIEEQTRKLEQRYDQQMTDFKQRLSDYYKEKIIARAKALAKQNKQKKEQEERKMRQYESEMTSKWTFKGVSRVAGTGPAPTPVAPVKEETGFIKIGKKTEGKTEPQAEVKVDDKSKQTWARKQVDGQKKEEAPVQPAGQKWGRKEVTTQPVVQPVPIATNTFVPPPPAEKKTFGAVPPVEKKTFGFGFGKKVEDKKQEKKDDGKQRPKKGYVNVN